MLSVYVYVLTPRHAKLTMPFGDQNGYGRIF